MLHWLQNDHTATPRQPVHSSECRGSLRSFRPSPDATPKESWLSTPTGSSSPQNTYARCRLRTVRLAAFSPGWLSTGARRTLSLLLIPANNSIHRRTRCPPGYLSDKASTLMPEAAGCSFSVQETCARCPQNQSVPADL